MRIGIIGAGFLAQAFAGLAVRHGHAVMLSNTRGADSLQALASGIGAQAGSVAEAAGFGPMVLLALPFSQRTTLPVPQLVGRIVMDAANHYPHRDGPVPELATHATTTSAMMAALLPGARLVKAFSAVLAKDLELPPEARIAHRALPIAGDDAAAKAEVAALQESFGYTVVDAGGLAESWRFERAKPAYCLPYDSAGLRAALARATREDELPDGSWRW